MGVDISRAFKAPFDDPDWVKKTLLGWLWFLLIFTMPAAYGASIEYIQRVARGDEGLPEWDDFGGKWVKGLLAMVAGFIYFLPVILIGTILVVPLAISANTSADGLTGLLAGGMCLFWVVAAVYIVGVSVLFYAALTNYAMKGHFGAFFEVGDILGKVKVQGYWTAWLFSIVVSIAASAITSVLSATTIGAILWGAVTYLQVMITAHLFGQWARGAYAVSPCIRSRGRRLPGPDHAAGSARLRAGTPGPRRAPAGPARARGSRPSSGGPATRGSGRSCRPGRARAGRSGRYACAPDTSRASGRARAFSAARTGRGACARCAGRSHARGRRDAPGRAGRASRALGARRAGIVPRRLADRGADRTRVKRVTAPEMRRTLWRRGPAVVATGSKLRTSR